MRKKNKTSQLGLFDQEDAPVLEVVRDLSWPAAARFPLNVDRTRTVEKQVMADLRESESPLLVVGYSALDHLIDLISEARKDGAEMRILFGSEPFPSRRERFELTQSDFPEEVQHYWLSRGISLRLSGKVIRAQELLRDGKVKARYLGTSRSRLHAKMYCGDDAITLGSSNFTDPGLKHQIEANARFTERDGARFTEARQIAENFWGRGTDYSQDLIELLNALLRVVTWEEALARGCAELLEGDWARGYLQQQLLPDDQPLWPSQIQGIAQALWLIETVGSVLVADATGSGKTRMGVHLLRSIVDKIWGSGRIRKGRPVMICPPSVASNWEREATLCGVGLDIRSHGALSQPSGEEREYVREAIRRAQILAVDEAHNFLNPKSARTRMLLGNMSDHTVLFTATPINKSAVDLLRLADMLGADNLDEDTLEMFRALLSRRSKYSNLTRSELLRLRSAIQRFTVRRTKSRLNQMVDDEPDAYKDARGKRCRYPEHHTTVYSLQESGPDKGIAAEIRSEASKLAGIALITKPIEMPEALIREDWDEGKYLHARLLGVRKLSGYLIMSALRSSKAALLEHLSGTTAALAEVRLTHHAKKQTTGDQMGALQRRSGRAPGSLLKMDVPPWLVDADAHRLMAAQELKVYERILTLARSLSTERETIKAQQLLALLDDHEQVVAFDSRPITLAYVANILKRKIGDSQIIVATGESPAGKKRARSALAPGSLSKGIVALCSDAMSEGVNLQQASAVVHLDMPSVVRIAEQRVGRVDRMDSPHKRIETYWPEDSPEFALRADDRFIERYETVESLIGSNMPLPVELSGGMSAVVRAADLAKEYEKSTSDSSWDGVQDAFAPVRELVAGATALVHGEVYEHYRHVSARVVSRVSLVKATHSWAFFCVSGTRFGAPHWVLIDRNRSDPLTQLKDIVEELRRKLTPATENLSFDDRAANTLDDMLTRLAQVERQLLPRRKQRALEEMEAVLGDYSQSASNERKGDLYDRLARILTVFSEKYRGRGVDWDTLAERWLDLVRPAWYARLLARKRLRPLTLREIRDDLLGDNELELDRIFAAFETIEALPPIEERVVSCIIGVP
jgi:hypothetical protein